MPACHQEVENLPVQADQRVALRLTVRTTSGHLNRTGGLIWDAELLECRNYRLLHLLRYWVKSCGCLGCSGIDRTVRVKKQKLVLL